MFDDLKVGGKYELTAQQIQNDNNIARITSKLINQYLEQLGRNPKVVKVFYQAKN